MAPKKQDGVVTLRKMDVKSIIENSVAQELKDQKAEEKDIFELFSAIGIIHRVRATTSKFGEGVAFKGEFYAERPDGAKFKSGEFFAPGNFRDELEGAWARRKDGEDTIEFGVKVSVQKDSAASAHGYAYITEPLIKAGSTMALSSLAERAFGKPVAALAAK